MLEPISLDNEQVIIHAFRAEEFSRYRQLVNEIYQILSDEETLRFIPEKRLNSVEEAESWLKASILNYHCGRNFIHFITDKKSGKLLGMIDIVSPSRAKEHYQLKQYSYFIEFYLKSNAKGRKIMTGLLPRIVVQLQQRKVQCLAAVSNRHNHAALKVLGRAGFEYRSPFDDRQDLYQLRVSSDVIRKAG
jgi:RimJ/RimL family protein N-acetyltransferase